MKLYFRKLGSGDPLIILHGLFGSSDNWLSVGKQLSEHFTVFLLDQRNHGQSPHSDEWTYEAMANDVSEFMEDHSLPKATILGHSMGGKVSMLFACLNPESIEKLVIADIAPKYYPVHHRKILDGLKSIDVKTLDSRQDADKQLLQYIPELGVRQFLLKSLARDDEGKYSWKINLKTIDEKIENVGIGLPANARYEGESLFIRGAKSNYVLNEDESLIQQHFPNAKLETIADSGHWIHAEQPEAFINSLNKFLLSS